MELDRDVCYRAVLARDARFDGRLFVGVTTTGVYCRPVCPARTPKLENCRFFVSAAAAQHAGFWPCLRCRPESAPDAPAWRGTSNTVARAVALIADGALDGTDADVGAFAARLGVGERHLRRLFDRHLGASPLAVAQTRRVLFAKQLIQETSLPLADVAFAAGYGSVRRFNETFRALYGRAPGALRTSGSRGSDLDAGVVLRLRYRPPYDWTAMLEHLAARAIDGVEEVDGGVYRRTFRDGGTIGIVDVRHDPSLHALAVSVRARDPRVLPAVVARVRNVFDLGADVEAIGAHLSGDPLLAPLVAGRPGLRVPGAWDGFELAVRAMLGQQVTVAAARRLACALVDLCAGAAPAPSVANAGPYRVFPTADEVVRADLDRLGMPSARRAALRALAVEAAASPDLLRPSGSVGDSVARLRGIRGVGDWTAQYVALRALRAPDAFPASDVVLRRAASGDTARRASTAELLRLAERWRPWRAYAAQHLWTASARPRDARDA